ncbi:MAG: vWA domain-containing protein [Planctomycetaceae bacterium]
MPKATTESTFRPPWLDESRWASVRPNHVPAHTSPANRTSEAESTRGILAPNTNESTSWFTSLIAAISDYLQPIRAEIRTWIRRQLPSMFEWHRRWRASLWSSLGIHTAAYLILAFMVSQTIERNPLASNLVNTRWSNETVETHIEQLVTVPLTPSIPQTQSPGGSALSPLVSSISSTTLVVREPKSESSNGYLPGLFQEDANSLVMAHLTEEVGLSSTSAAAGGAGNGTGSGIGDGDQNFFGIPVDGKKFVFVVDASRSMNHPHDGPAKTRFGRLKIELVNTIGQMTEENQFFVIFFNDRAIPMPSDRLVHATKDNQLTCLEWVATAHTGGQTDPREALMLALNLNPDIIYFLTDGEFEYRVVKDVKAANKQKTPIYTFCFSDRAGEKFLKQIAEQNHGEYYYIP